MRRCELVGWAKVMIAVSFTMGAVFCFGICPRIGKQFVDAYPDVSYLFWPCLIFVWATAVPFVAALVQSWKICNAVQRGQAFCSQNAARLKHISFMAFSECILYFAMLTFLAISDLLHPAVLLLILVILCIGFAAAISSAVLSHLTAKAVNLQDENDLTI